MKTSVAQVFCLVFVLALSLSGCGSGEPDPASVVVLNFWATWCQPCMSEIPELKQVAASSKAKVIGIALDQDGVKTIKPFVASNNINYTVLVGDEEVFQRFNGVGIPYTLVLDPSQRIVKIYRGPTTKQALEQDLKAISQGTQLSAVRGHGAFQTQD